MVEAGELCMAADSVGQIGLDLVVNRGSFNKQMAGIQSLAKKAGLALAAAFSVKKIWDFGAACVELGSDLAEVQNVVDVTFPQMSKQVNAFAKDAITSFGLSETMAKRFTGTFGAMAKAFGFNQQAAYEMSTTLTGLAGDVASFYNISQDEAYTKLKSVFTGETESLKDLGVVMTQAALDQYALANGYGKTTQAMSEAEKVALRYKFVQDQLSLASGDFIRTSDSWANQVRVLKLRFDSLKATIGQGLINVLTPVIQVINAIISKLMSLANAFKAFTELITGKKGSGGGASVAAAGMEAVASSADQAGSAMGGAGRAAKKAAKDLKTVTTGIDELNIIDQGTDSGSGGSGGSAGGGYSADQFDMGTLPEEAGKTNVVLDSILAKMKELAGIFKEGFSSGLGDTAVFDSIEESIQGIKSSLAGIFTDPAVVKAADQLAVSIAYSMGQISGSMASIGASLADNLLSGVDRYLAQNGGRITDYLVSMFDIGSKVAQIAGNFSKALATIFSAFRSDSAKQITADLIGIFSAAFMGITELCSSFVTDILDLFTGLFVDNADQIRSALEETFGAVEPALSSIKELVGDVFSGIMELYNGHIAPMLTAFRDGFSEIAAVLLELYNTYFLPVIQNLSAQFAAFNAQYLSPVIDKFLEFGGTVADCITVLWTTVLQPFITWFLETAAPVIAEFAQGAIDTFFTLFSSITEVVGYILEALNGLITFIVGVFTGNWQMAWEGIRDFFSGIWESMKSIVAGAINNIKSVITAAWNLLKALTTTVWTAIKTVLSGIWETLKTLATTLFEAIKTAISTAWEAVQASTSASWDGIKNTLGNLWETLKTTASSTFTSIKDAIVGAWTTVKDQTKQIWDGIWSVIKGVINSIIGGVESMVNRVIDGINAMIEAVNDVADHVPGVSDELIPKIKTIRLPRLAQGGFVKANTPQLAMIGDNRHYGEIVAPEDKMQEMVDRAVTMATENSRQGMSEFYLETMVELLRRIIELIENMDLTVNIDLREVKKKLTDLEKRTGYTLRTT